MVTKVKLDTSADMKKMLIGELQTVLSGVDYKPERCQTICRFSQQVLNYTKLELRAKSKGVSQESTPVKLVR